MAFSIKVKVTSQKCNRLILDRRELMRGSATIEIPDSYLAAIENARKAEIRGVQRLCLWIAEKHPDVYEKENLREFLEA